MTCTSMISLRGGSAQDNLTYVQLDAAAVECNRGNQRVGSPGQAAGDDQAQHVLRGTNFEILSIRHNPPRRSTKSFQLGKVC